LTLSTLFFCPETAREKRTTQEENNNTLLIVPVFDNLQEKRGRGEKKQKRRHG